MEKWLTVLNEGRRLFEEKGLKWGSYELQKQMLPILEQLVESGLSGENGMFKEDLEKLERS